MTVTTETSSSSYTGNGVTTTFAVGFVFAHAAEVVVTVGGVVQTQGVAYSVVGSNVVFGVAPAAAAAIVIQRLVTYTQPTNFRTQGSFSPEVHESQMDAIVFQTQQLSRALTAAVARIAVLEAAGVGGGGGLTQEQVEALILAAISGHSDFNHFRFDNGQTILDSSGSVFGVPTGHITLMSLVNGTAGPLSLIADPPLQLLGSPENQAIVVLVNDSPDAITFNGGSFIVLQGGSCTLMEDETLTLVYSGPYLGQKWIEVSRSRTLVLPP